jgi:hypothetical protein
MYHIGCRGKTRAAPRRHRQTLQSQCGHLEGGPVVTMTGAACFFLACNSSPAGNGDDEE